MRCLSCNKRLTDYESTIKNDKGEYLDFCKRCLSYISVPHYGNPLAEDYFSEGVDSIADDVYNSIYAGDDE